MPGIWVIVIHIFIVRVVDIVANDIQMLDSPSNRVEIDQESPAEKDLEIPEDVEPTDDDTVPF